MSEIKGDYMGFTYNGAHSSTLGIVRTSDGSRFNENLLPTIQDKTVQVPGGDGTYFFGSYYTQRQFTINFAFDSLTEEQLNRVKSLFGDKQIHELIFDEAPYKAYNAKVTGSATIKHIPFSEGKNNRVYKGEGSIQFTCYYPFAHSVKKYLDQYRKLIARETYYSLKYDEPQQVQLIEYLDLNKNYFITINGVECLDNQILGQEGELVYGSIDSMELYWAASLRNGELYIFHLKEGETKEISIKIEEEIEEFKNLVEWKDAANLLPTQGDFDKLSNSNKINLYNPGEKETDFVLSLIFESDKIPSGSITLNEKKLSFKEITKQDADDEIRINTRLNLIEGYKDGKKTGNLYNKYINGGNFFKIPVTTATSFPLQIVLEQIQGNFNWIDYNYLYL